MRRGFVAWVMTLIGTSGTSDVPLEDVPLGGPLPDIAAAIARALGIGAEPDWLAPCVACDLPIDSLMPETAERAARDTIGEAAIDVIVQRQAGRRKRVLAADLEST